MIEIMQAHWLTFLIVLVSILITPFYWFWVLPKNKAKKMAIITAILAAIMILITIFRVPEKLGIHGGIFIAAMWIIPSIIIWNKRKWFKEANQKQLVKFQIIRVIGALFLLEMTRMNLSGYFAWPAGIGDIIVGLTALTIILIYKKIPKKAAMTLIIVGILDFILAFFFAATASQSPIIFKSTIENNLDLFPIYLVPLFMVPYAIVYHTISLIKIKKI